MKKEPTYPYWYISLLVDIILLFVLSYVVDLIWRWEEFYWWSFAVVVLSVVGVTLLGIIIWPLLSKEE